MRKQSSAEVERSSLSLSLYTSQNPLLKNFYFSRHGFEVTLSTTRALSTVDAAR